MEKLAKAVRDKKLTAVNSSNDMNRRNTSHTCKVRTPCWMCITPRAAACELSRSDPLHTLTNCYIYYLCIAADHCSAAFLSSVAVAAFSSRRYTAEGTIATPLSVLAISTASTSGSAPACSSASGASKRAATLSPLCKQLRPLSSVRRGSAPRSSSRAAAAPVLA
eukprot:15713-Heterococcus_DN1.PRE.5